MSNHSNEILVSIICTSYNHGPYIADALEGFVQQKVNFKFEIIVHDDASTDNTVDIVVEYKGKYPELFNVIFQENNQYSIDVNLPLLNCFSVAKGKYIAFCEGDDYWYDVDKLQKQVDILENNLSYGMVFTDFDMLYERTGIIKKSCFKFDPKSFPIVTNLSDFILARSYMAPCSWLMRREHTYTPTRQALDGTFCWLVDILAASKIYFLNDTTTVYRVLGESASHSKSFGKMLKRENDILKMQIFYCERYHFSKSLSDAINAKHMNKTFHLHIGLNNQAEIYNIRKSYSKLSLRAKVLFYLSYLPYSSALIKFLYNYKDTLKRVI